MPVQHSSDAHSSAHGAGDEHHFYGIPADAPGPDEPRTPGSLTLLGVALLLGLLLFAALRTPSEKTRAELTQGSAPAPASAAPQAPAAAEGDAARPRAPFFGKAVPKPSAAPGVATAVASGFPGLRIGPGGVLPAPGGPRPVPAPPPAPPPRPARPSVPQ
jgi:hypothetical protein